MTSFILVWFFILFILQVMGLGIHMGKLGELKITNILIYLIVCTIWRTLKNE